MTLNPFATYEIRDYRHDDAAALFVIQAAIAPVAAGEMLAWTQEIEARAEDGGRVWVAARGRSLAGYVSIDPLPGLPGIFDLSGGIVPARRRQGIGGRLLAHAVSHAPALGARELSARVESLADDTARFLLRRGFAPEHEECLLELAGLSDLPPEPAGGFVTLPRERAISEFCRLYGRSFDGRPWSQPYTEAEVAAMLGRPEDLLFAARDGELLGVVWHEKLPDGRGRVEPIGIAREHQRLGHGRRLLLAALHSLRRQAANPVEIGLWRTNETAMNLYKSLGFREVANWYYLAQQVPLHGH